MGNSNSGGEEMRKRGGRLTYANAVSTICLFILLGGGAAFAAAQLGKNSVGSKQLKKNAVTTAKLRNGAIVNSKIADGAVSGAKVAGGSLTGADIDQATLTSVRASNVLAISVDANCAPTGALLAGVSAERTSEGVCKFTFPNPVASCATTASVHLRLLPNDIVLAGERTVQISTVSSTPNILTTASYLAGTKRDLPFDMVLVC